MADFGSNFIDAFSAVYGAGMKKKFMDTEEKRAFAAEKRAQVDFDYTQKQRRNQETVQRAIASAGNVIKPNADTSGAMNESQMQGLKGLPAAAPSMRDLQYSLKYGLEADPNQPMTAGAPAPVPVPTAPQAAIPNAAPAPVPTPAPVAPAAPQAALPGTTPPHTQISGQPPAQNMERFTGKNATLPAANAPIPVSNPDENGNIMTVAPDAQVVSEKQVKSLPNPDDYVQTTLNGRTVYVPKDKVTVLSGGDLAVAQGNAILRTGFDSQLGQTMIANGMKIQADTIAATADKYQRAVLASQATGNLDGLKQAWDDLYPAAGKADITEKDGQITVSHYIQTADGKKVTVGDPEVFKSDQLHTAREKLFFKSMAMGSPQTMVSYNAQQSQDIVHVATLVHQKLQDDLDTKRTYMAIKTGEASIRASDAATAASRADQGWTVKMDETGQAYRTNKAGVIQMASSVWNDEFVAPRFKDNTKLAQTMAATAQARGLSIAISPDGIPMYANAQGQASANPDDVSKPTKPTPTAAPRATPTAKPLPLTETRAAKLAKLKAIVADPKQSSRTKAGAQAQISGLQNEEVEARKQAARGKSIAASTKNSGLGNVDLGSD